MTDPQKSFYFKLWSAACKANGWRTEAGRVQLDKTIKSEHSDKVVYLAKRIAVNETRGLKLDDLRHAATIVATGKAISSKADWKPVEFGRLKTLLELLTNPDDLNAVTHWNNPDMETKKFLIGGIRRLAPEAYIRKISGGKFDTIYWEDLSILQLRHLLMTLKNRRPGFTKPARARAVHENQPF
jgi:hypothetical protein